MSLSDRLAETIYRIATGGRKLRLALTPLGLTFWFGLSTLLVFASLWLDGVLPIRLLLTMLARIFLAVPLLGIGATLCLWTVFGFLKARGTPVPLNPPQRLVVTGPYSRMRNPMVFGWIIMLFGLGILLNSISLIFIFTPLFLLLNLLYLKAVEEKEMAKKFGQEYLKYKESVPMLFPRLGRRHDRGGRVESNR